MYFPGERISVGALALLCSPQIIKVPEPMPPQTIVKNKASNVDMVRADQRRQFRASRCCCRRCWHEKKHKKRGGIPQCAFVRGR